MERSLHTQITSDVLTRYASIKKDYPFICSPQIVRHLSHPDQDHLWLTYNNFRKLDTLPIGTLVRVSRSALAADPYQWDGNWLAQTVNHNLKLIHSHYGPDFSYVMIHSFSHFDYVRINNNQPNWSKYEILLRNFPKIHTIGITL